MVGLPVLNHGNMAKRPQALFTDIHGFFLFLFSLTPEFQIYKSDHFPVNTVMGVGTPPG